MNAKGLRPNVKYHYDPQSDEWVPEDGGQRVPGYLSPVRNMPSGLSYADDRLSALDDLSQTEIGEKEQR